MPISCKQTRVIELNKDFIVDISFMKIIDYNCKLNGSSYIGRYESAKMLLGSTSKVPIYIEESRNMIFIPTNSIRNKDCWWISYNNIQNYIKKGDKICLQFANSKNLILNISYKVFERQFVKASKLTMVTRTQKSLLK